jgi:hypothetical protein
MSAIKFAAILSVLIVSGWVNEVTSAGMATSTVDQDGTKTGFNMGAGSASKIGVFDFNFHSGLAGIEFIQARIRLSVQLPPEAIGDLAPQIVFAKVGTINLAQALITGDAIRTDIRISYNLFPSGTGVVEKTTDFEDLTRQQGLALSSILANDPSYRLEAWLASDSLTAITVPASGEYLDSTGQFPIVVFQRFDSTLDLVFVPEPSSGLAFAGLGLLFLILGRRSFLRRWKKIPNQTIRSLCLS